MDDGTIRVLLATENLSQCLVRFLNLDLSLGQKHVQLQLPLLVYSQDVLEVCILSDGMVVVLLRLQVNETVQGDEVESLLFKIVFR